MLKEKTEKIEKTTERLSDAEFDIMKVLWQSGKPLRAGEIVKLLSETRSWKTQTAHVLLNRLCEKGYVTADKSEYFHHFTPTMTESEYLAAESTTLMKKVGGSVRSMIASLIDTEGVTDEDISAISDILEKKRAEIRKDKPGEDR